MSLPSNSKKSSMFDKFTKNMTSLARSRSDIENDKDSVTEQVETIEGTKLINFDGPALASMIASQLENSTNPHVNVWILQSAPPQGTIEYMNDTLISIINNTAINILLVIIVLPENISGGGADDDQGKDAPLQKFMTKLKVICGYKEEAPHADDDNDSYGSTVVSAMGSESLYTLNILHPAICLVNVRPFDAICSTLKNDAFIEELSKLMYQQKMMSRRAISRILLDMPGNHVISIHMRELGVRYEREMLKVVSKEFQYCIDEFFSLHYLHHFKIEDDKGELASIISHPAHKHTMKRSPSNVKRSSPSKSIKHKNKKKI